MRRKKEASGSRNGAQTPSQFLQALHLRGATQVRRIRFRDNRSTVWSLTRRGTVLNLHDAFQDAPPAVLDAFATLAKEGGIGSAPSRKAAARVQSWPPLASAMRESRARYAERRRAMATPLHCCGTEDQREYVRRLFLYFNRTRFAANLPDDLPLRLSRRMKSALGHMRPGRAGDGTRYVAEIALNVDLLLEGNGATRIDTLLHEMAHAVDFLETGNRGHGPSWRAWARRVGCRPTRLHDRPVSNRRRRRDPVSRVPPLPMALRALHAP